MNDTDLLRRAADAMVAEAERSEALGAGATDAPWEPGCLCCEGDELVGPTGYMAKDFEHREDLDLIAHRRNTLARDAKVLRATADLIRGDADAGYEQREVVAIARAFLGETAGDPAATPPDGTTQPDPDAVCAVCGTARAEHTLTTHTWTDDGPRPGPGFVHRASS